MGTELLTSFSNKEVHIPGGDASGAKIIRRVRVMMGVKQGDTDSGPRE